MKVLLAVTAILTATLVWTATQAADPPSSRSIPAELPLAEQVRMRLFDELRPVRVSNCVLERFGEPTDGGYLMCGNLLTYSQAAYSYGINGYDGWGCDVATRLASTTHQYDCFNVDVPVCTTGRTVFHPLCVAGAERSDEQGRRFESLSKQIADNGDHLRRLVVKMDVEGAEWETLLRTPNETLRRIDQLVLELHGVEEERFVAVVQKLKRIFHVAHLHINNYSCGDKYRPFPGWAYEVLLVNKRLARRVPGPVPLPHPLDSPNYPDSPDCQPRSAASGRPSS
jgi:hypothetical protein